MPWPGREPGKTGDVVVCAAFWRKNGVAFASLCCHSLICESCRKNLDYDGINVHLKKGPAPRRSLLSDRQIWQHDTQRPFFNNPFRMNLALAISNQIVCCHLLFVITCHFLSLRGQNETKKQQKYLRYMSLMRLV